ncbi:MAG: hypothetical protein ACLPXZ_24470 [Mycobacterium sp.]
MKHDERTRIRAAGKHAAAKLPEISAECAKHIAELIREPINTYVKAERDRRAS